MLPRQGFRMSNYSVVSLFSGCGGMDLGFLGGFNFLNKRYKKNKFKIIWANELNKAACKTYQYNISPHITPGDIWENINKVPSKADVVIGGFPCQDISINGKKAGVAGARSGLYTAMVSVVDRLRPKVFVAENVKGLLLSYNQDSLNKVISDFESLGYKVNYAVYNAADYGVPQTRERVFIIGTPIDAKPYVHAEKVSNPSSWITAEKAIRDLEEADEKSLPNHIWSKAKKSPQQGSRILKAERPATTIRAECHGNIQFHYKLPRRISMREAARFQSFPDSFEFQSGIRETERQIGNAVPPVLGWHIAKSVQMYLEEIHSPPLEDLEDNSMFQEEMILSI